MLNDQPKYVVKELVKSGLKITPDNIKKFLVFSAFGIHRVDFIKNKQLQKDYNKRIVRINGNVVGTNQVFDHVFRIDLKNNGTQIHSNGNSNGNFTLLKIREELVKNCRYGCPDLFKYAHNKHLETGKKRDGANFAFIHPIRVWEILETELINLSEEKSNLIRDVALLHDVVEDMQSFREKKFSKKIIEKLKYQTKIPKTNMTSRISSMLINQKGNNSNVAQNTIVEDQCISELHTQILNPPEYSEINSLFENKDYSNQLVTHLWAVTHGAESEKKYFLRMIGVSKNLFEEQKPNYDVALLVKFGDIIDNTTTLPERGASSQLKRFKKNLLFLQTFDSNFSEIISQNSNIKKLRHECIECSKESIHLLINTYQPEMKEGSRKFSPVELKDYGVILKKLNFYKNEFEKLNNY